MNQIRIITKRKQAKDNEIVIELDNRYNLACNIDTGYIVKLAMFHIEYKYRFLESNLIKDIEILDKIANLISDGIINTLPELINILYEETHSIQETVEELNLLNLEAEVFSFMIDEITEEVGILLTQYKKDELI